MFDVIGKLSALVNFATGCVSDPLKAVAGGWNRLLDRGTTCEPKSNKIDRDGAIYIAALAILCAALWGWTCGHWDLWGPDEARYVQIAKEMRAGSGLFHLTLFGQTYNEKMPPPFWILAAMLKLNGGAVSSWALRLPSVIFASMTVILCFLTGRRLFGDRAGFIAALVLASSSQFLDDAPKAQLDMMFTGFIALAMYAWLTRPDQGAMRIGRALTMWLALCAAVFFKGPLAIVIGISPIVALALWSRSWRPFHDSRMLRGAALVFIVAVAWFALQTHANGMAFTLHQIREQTIDRFLNGDHAGLWWYYIPRLFTSIFMPWAVVLIPLGMRIWRKPSVLSRGTVELLGWAVLPLLFLSVASGKRQAYLLPLLPAMSLLVGWHLNNALQGYRRFPHFNKLVSGAYLALGIFLVAFAIAARLRQDLFWGRSFYIVPDGMHALATLGLLSVLAALWLRHSKGDALALIHAVAALFLLAGLVEYLVVFPSINPEKSTRQFAGQLTQMLAVKGGQAVIGAVGKSTKPEYHAYGSYRVVEYDDWNATLDSKAPLPDFLVAVKGKTDKIPSALTQPGGFSLAYGATVSGDDMLIYERNKPVEASKPGFQFEFVGDTAYKPEHSARVAQQMALVDQAKPVDALFLLGDNLEKHGNFQKAVQEAFVVPFKPVIDRKIPIYAILGNHDVTSDHSFDETNFPLFNMNGRAYYSKTFGDKQVTFFMLDSENLGEQPDQYVWFKNALNNCDSHWKILLLHHALIASDIAHGSKLSYYRLLLPIMQGSHDIDLVITGHNHIYERRNVRDGILNLTVGCGCTTLDTPLPPDPGRATGSTDRLGFAVLNVQNERIDLQAIDDKGQVFDTAEVYDMDNPPDVRVISKSVAPDRGDP